MPPRFEPFALAHLAAIALTLATAAALVVLLRRRPRWGRAVRAGMAAAIAGATAATLLRWGAEQRLTVWDVLPLHLCDFLLLLAVFALATLRPWACELLYFWAGAGTLLAIVWPDVGAAFPDWRFVSFFALHGLIVVAAAVVVVGFHRRPRAGAPWRVLLLTNAYAAVAGVVNVAFGTNYLYLRRKPAGGGPLDWLGPWPVYIVAAEGLALVLFFVLDLPFRSRRGARESETPRRK